MEPSHNKPVLILIHAFPMDAAMWGNQREAFQDSMEVHTPDLPGFGSEPPSTETSLGMDAAALFIRNYLEHHAIGRCIIGGLSMGGYVAFECWRLFPEKIAGLLLADTRAGADTDEERAGRYAAMERVERGGYEEFTETLLQKLVADRTRKEQPDVLESIRMIMRRNRPQSAVQALRGMAERRDARELLPQLSVPVGLIFGNNDTITPVEVGEEMCAAIPDARLTCIRKAGHLPNMEQPERFNEAARDLIARVTL